MKICRYHRKPARAHCPRPGKKRSALSRPWASCTTGTSAWCDAAAQENDLAVVSIFVNPAQFGPAEDLQRYPRDAERDIALLEKEKTDLLFMPDDERNVPARRTAPTSASKAWKTSFAASRAPAIFAAWPRWCSSSSTWCGPQRAYFGQKDAQQAIIIRRMVRDLDLPVQRQGPAHRARSRRPGPLFAQRLSVPGGTAGGPGPAQVPGSRRGPGRRRAWGRAGSSGDAMREELDHDPCSAHRIHRHRPPAGPGRIFAVIEPGNTLIAAAIRVGKTRLIDNLLLGDLSC